MKKTLSAVLFVLLIAISFSSCGKKDVTTSGTISNMPAYGSRHVTAFGDSIAAGYGLSDQSTNYLSIFSKNIGATLKNDAVSGYDSADLLTLLNGGTVTADITSANIIVLSIGGNDVLHQKDLLIETLKNAKLHGGEYFTDEINAIYSTYETNLLSIINFIKAKNPAASIIIQTVYNPVEKQGYKVSVINVGKMVNRYIDKLNDSIVSVCKTQSNVYIFDVAKTMNKDAANFYDAKVEFDIHPTVYGHASLAKIYTDDFNALVK